MIDPPSFISVKAFCTVNNVPFTLRSKSLSKCSSVRLAKRPNSPTPALATRTSIFPFALTSGLVEAIEVRQFRDVPANAYDVAADRLHGLVEFSLTAARYEDKGAFVDEALRRGETYSRRAAGNHGHLFPVTYSPVNGTPRNLANLFSTRW